MNVHQRKRLLHDYAGQKSPIKFYIDNNYSPQVIGAKKRRLDDILLSKKFQGEDELVKEMLSVYINELKVYDNKRKREKEMVPVKGSDYMSSDIDAEDKQKQAEIQQRRLKEKERRLQEAKVRGFLEAEEKRRQEEIREKQEEIRKKPNITKKVNQPLIRDPTNPNKLIKNPEYQKP